MAGANASTIPFTRKPPPWIAPPAENLWRNHAFKSGTFHAPGTNASIPDVRDVTSESPPILLGMKCPVCGSEMVYVEVNEGGRKYKKYVCLKCD